MKRNDTLFAKAYEQIVFCGSFYKGTKISKPNEFDINIVLNLRKCIIHPNNIQLIKAKPAFVGIRIHDFWDIPHSQKYALTNKEKRQLRKLMHNNYLHPCRFLSWIQKTLSDLNKQLPICYKSFKLIKISSSGPAFTLLLKNYNCEKEFSVDIVPVLTFDTDILCTINSKYNWRGTKGTWFAVAVPPKNSYTEFLDESPPWRQSFVYQENKILSQHGRIKQIIRLLKKLKETWGWYNIASYFIETIFLNKLIDIKDILDRKSSTWIFYVMLKEMHRCFEEHTIEYFWDPEYNLLSKIGIIEMQNITRCLRHIIERIRLYIVSNPLIIADIILDDEEYESLMKEYNARDTNINGDNQEQSSWKCIIS
ncbi:cGAS-like receptor 1 isoform X2 [Augochlora pura]